jgi:hypothetical protein
MRFAHMTQGFYSHSLATDVKLHAILGVIKKENLSGTAFDLAAVGNPESTGIWDGNGQFDDHVFGQLKDLAFYDQGKMIVTAREFDLLRGITKQARLAELRRWNLERLEIPTVSARIFGGILPISWKQVTDGSIYELLRYYGDHTYVDEHGSSHCAMTIERAAQFYRDPMSVMLQKRADVVSDVS